jgi:hypothetical protein
VSAQQPEPTTPVTSSQGEPVTASDPALINVESPNLAPEQEETVLQDDLPRVEAVGQDAPLAPGKVLIMSPGDRTGPKTRARISAIAAVVALAAAVGALSGVMTSGGLGHNGAGDVAGTKNDAVEASLARIDAEILALKASVENTSRLDVSQFNKASDRLDKIEKAQAEPIAKLARLSEVVDKLRAAPTALPAPARDVTGSVSPPAAASAPQAVAPKTEVARLPTLEGWVLRDVANGSALIQGRRRIYEVYAGDPVPGLGRVDAIRRQDGRWVVVTTKGLIVAR